MKRWYFETGIWIRDRCADRGSAGSEFAGRAGVQPYDPCQDRGSGGELIPAPFMVGISAGDGTAEGSIAADRAFKVTSKAYDGAIVVMHCFQGNDETVEALQTILPELKAQGYKFVTVSELYLESGCKIPGPTSGVKFYDNKPIE